MKKLNSFKNFIDNLSETMDYEYDVDWKEFENDYVGYFKTKNNKYRILIINKGYDIFYFKFQILINKNWEFFSSGDEKEFLKVLSTIRKQILKFLKNYNPNSVIFYSFDSNRSLLYKRFCESLVKNEDYKYYSDVKNRIFVIYNEDTDFTNIKEIINNLNSENYNYDNYD
jgi:hypothetical protein